MNFSQKTLGEIKEYFNGDCEISEELEVAIQSDGRAGVRALYRQYCNKKLKFEREVARLNGLQLYEEEAYNQGYQYIAGVDEAGRGPLAGPVVAAAVIMPRGTKIFGINDSKKISPEKRAELVVEIKAKAIAWSVGIVDVDFIDKFNILQASLKAMHDAVKGLELLPHYLLIDAVRIPHIEVPQLPIIGGDGKSMSIAAASIIAKTTRDGMMEELHQQYPHYAFDKHKGYGTAEHVAAIKKHGTCPAHRVSFNIVKQFNK